MLTIGIATVGIGTRWGGVGVDTLRSVSQQQRNETSRSETLHPQTETQRSESYDPRHAHQTGGSGGWDMCS